MEYHGVCNDILTTSSVFYPSHHHSSVMTGCSGHQLISSFHFSFVSKISIVSSHLQLHQSLIKITVRSHWYCVLWDGYWVVWVQSPPEMSPVWCLLSYQMCGDRRAPGPHLLSHLADCSCQACNDYNSGSQKSNQVISHRQFSALINWSHINLAGYCR